MIFTIETDDEVSGIEITNALSYAGIFHTIKSELPSDDLARITGGLDKLVRYLINEGLVKTDDMPNEDAPDEAVKVIARITAENIALRKALKLSAEMFHGSALAYGGSIHDAGKFTDCNNGYCLEATALVKGPHFTPEHLAKQTPLH